MDNTIVNVEAIEEFINSLETDFMAKLRDQNAQIIATYNNIRVSGKLSNSEIDQALQGITSKIDKIESEFIELSTRMRNSLNEAKAIIEQKTVATTDELKEGM